MKNVIAVLTFLLSSQYNPPPKSSGPTGPAGGDLTGTYPNPTVGSAKISAAKMASGAAVTNIGYTPAHSGANSDITSITGLSTPLAIGQGGTGSATQNFVDLTTAQASIAGNKTFTSVLAPTGGITILNPAQNTSLVDVNYFGTHMLTIDSTNLRTAIGPGATFQDSNRDAITAAGTNQATCTQLDSDKTNVTTVASGTGVCLPKTVAGSHFVVHTTGANSLLIYANPAGGTLNGQSSTTGITLTNVSGSTPGTRIIDCYSSTACFSAASLPDAN